MNAQWDNVLGTNSFFLVDFLKLMHPHIYFTAGQTLKYQMLIDNA